jgi:HK97 family phage portal protein
MHCPKHPLVGESPITAALIPATTGMEINRHTATFFHNLSRPSGILRHPGTLSPEAMDRLKKKFIEVTQRGSFGEPVVLQEDMDWKPLTMSAVDAELINSFKLTERQVAQVFRIPPFLLGDLEKATFQNVESLSSFFVQSSLGWYVDHIEDNLTIFFGLPSDEYIEFDVETALLRTDLKERMEAYSKGIQNGVFSPNEARARESLPPVEDGDQPRVQQQLVPLSYGMQMQPKGVGLESVPAQPSEDIPDDKEDDTPEKQEAAAFIARRAIERAMLESI